MKRNVQDMYFIRSKFNNNILTIEAVHNEPDVEIVFSRHEYRYENEHDANLELEAYKRLLSDDNNVLKLMFIGIAEFFEVEWKGKHWKEVIELIRLRRIELEKELEQNV